MFPGRKRDDLVHGPDASIHKVLDREVARLRVARGPLQRQPVRVHE
jgi:hypothetical protein